MTEIRGRRGIYTNNIAVHEDEEQADYDDDSTDELDESRHPLEDSGCTRSASSDEEDEAEGLDDRVAEDMRRFEESFKGITKRYRLVNQIGEGGKTT